MKNLIKLIFTLSCVLLIISAFTALKTLKGTWVFKGGIYNGKKEGAPAGYVLQRKYDAEHYEAVAIQGSNKPEKYETGDYKLKGDTCIETQTFSSQPSKLTGIPVHYVYSIRHDTLILKATLPTGLKVEEYWKRKK